MELSSQDVIRLYGRYLFAIPKAEKQADDVLTTAEMPEVNAEPIEEKPVAVEPIEAVVEKEKAPVIAEKPVEAQTEVVAEALEEVPEKEETPQVSPTHAPELTSGQPVDWKMKAQSRIAMVMQESEFKNRAMTIVLRDCVERAGMATSLIGFGVLKAGETDFDFRQQPVPFSLVFYPEVSKKQIIQLADGQEVYPLPTVTEIVLNQDKQQALISLLQELNQRL